MGRKYEMLIRSRGDSNDAIRSMRKLQGELTSMGHNMREAGSKMSRYITLPTAVAGAAAVKLSADFNQSMTNIEALVGTSHRQVSAWSKEILNLSGELPQGPKELADALYYVTSSGFSGAAAMRVLDASARAAAAGLGSTQTVADAVTSAVSAYGESNLTATAAADALVAAVREGKGEASEFAGQIGKVIPISAELGVSFQDVTGAVAAMTRGGLDAAESTTALRQLMNLIIHPAVGAREALEGAGVSLETLRGILTKKGLLAGLQYMRKGLKGNVDVIGESIPNIRALAGFLNLTGTNADAVAGVMNRVNASAGDMDKAFKKASKASLFQLRKGLSHLKVLLIEVGDIMMPTVIRAVKGFGKLVQKFRELDSHTKKQIVVFVAIAAAIGPVLMVVGSLVLAVSAMIPAIMGMGGAFVPLLAVVVGAGVALHKMGVSLGDVARFMQRHQTVLTFLVSSFAAYKVALVAVTIAQAQWVAVSRVGPILSLVFGVRSLAGAAALAKTALNGLKVAMLTNPATALAAAIGIAVGAIMAYRNHTRDSVTTQRGFNKTLKDTKARLDDLRDAELLASDAGFARIDASKELQAAQSAAAAAIRKHGKDSVQAEGAMYRVAKASAAVRKAQADIVKAYAGSDKAQRKSLKSLQSNLDKQAQLKTEIVGTKRALAMARTDGSYLDAGRIKKELTSLEGKYKRLGNTIGDQRTKIRGNTRLTATDIRLIAKSLGISEAAAIKMVSTTKKQMAQLTAAVRGEAPAIATAGATIGRELSRGVASGMTSGQQNVVNAAMKLIGLAKKTMKDQSKIESPSKVFASQIGFPIALGIAAGIMRGSGHVNAAGQKLVERLQARLDNVSKNFSMKRSYANLLREIHGGERKSDIRRLMRIDLQEFNRLKRLLKRNRRHLTMEQKTSIMDQMTGLISDWRGLKNELNAPAGGGSGGGLGPTGPVVINQHFSSEPDMFAASQSAAWAYRAAIMRVS